jgi:hypothetical protein
MEEKEEWISSRRKEEKEEWISSSKKEEKEDRYQTEESISFISREVKEMKRV